MIVAVFGTNVLASGIVGIARATSTPGELLRRWRRRMFTLVVSEPILAELARTLTDPYFADRLGPAEIAEVFARLRTDAYVQHVTVHVAGIATHPEDDPILATAISARADCLVTGDHELLALGSYGPVSIASPSMFRQWLDRHQ